MYRPDDPERDGIIPAGYTYLAQFVTHDLTFDPSPVPVRPRAGLANLRTPSFDLDSVIDFLGAFDRQRVPRYRHRPWPNPTLFPAA